MFGRGIIRGIDLSPIPLPSIPLPIIPPSARPPGFQPWFWLRLAALCLCVEFLPPYRIVTAGPAGSDEATRQSAFSKRPPVLFDLALPGATLRRREEKQVIQGMIHSSLQMPAGVLHFPSR
jgi:hypothetical protein